MGTDTDILLTRIAAIKRSVAAAKTAVDRTAGQAESAKTSLLNSARTLRTTFGFQSQKAGDLLREADAALVAARGEVQAALELAESKVYAVSSKWGPK